MASISPCSASCSETQRWSRPKPSTCPCLQELSHRSGASILPGRCVGKWPPESGAPGQAAIVRESRARALGVFRTSRLSFASLYRPLWVATRRAPELGGMASESGGMAGNQFVVSSFSASGTLPVCLGRVAILIQYAGQLGCVIRVIGLAAPAGGCRAMASSRSPSSASTSARWLPSAFVHRPARVARRRRTSSCALGEDGRLPATYGHAGTQAGPAETATRRG